MHDGWVLSWLLAACAGEQIPAGGDRADGQGRGDYVLAYRLTASPASD